MKSCFVVCAGACAALLAAPAFAEIVAFSNFVQSGPSAPYDPFGDSITLSGSPRWGIGYRFTSLESGAVDFIDIGLFAGSASAAGSGFSWSIHADDARSLGTALVTSADSLVFPGLTPARIVPDSTISLVAGGSYWITVSGEVNPDSSPVWLWGDTDPAYQDAFALLLGGTEWLAIDSPVPQGAYKIVLVPAPGAASLLMLGGCAMSRRSRRR